MEEVTITIKTSVKNKTEENKLRYILLNTDFISFNIDEGVDDVTVILKGRVGRDFYLDFPVL